LGLTESSSVTKPGRPTIACLSLRSLTADLRLPVETTVLEPRDVDPLPDVQQALSEGLKAPIGTQAFSDLCASKLRQKKDCSAVVVISDNTRPVPYTGPSGILWPIVTRLVEAGFAPANVTVLVASGMHRPLTDDEIALMLDERVVHSGVSIRSHDAFDPGSVGRVGRSNGGTDVLMNQIYANADLKILTGLVESHCIAGTSGGRKSICPGLVDIGSLSEFHGPRALADPRATDLILAGNPSHELALEIARMAPADFIVNITAREDGAVMGVFAGDMEQAHEAATEHLRSFAQIPLPKLYDVVIVHGGKVGVNHYQVVKAANQAARAAKRGGHVVVVADTVDSDPIGGDSYRALMTLLRAIGSDAYFRLIHSSDWTFVAEQWGVQLWANILDRIPPSNLFYFSPQTSARDYRTIPCVDPGDLVVGFEGLTSGQQVSEFVERAVSLACERSAACTGTTPAVAYLPAGPSGIPHEGVREFAE
jgi:lactate racemase